MTTDPIICRHVGRSTWQGPASAAPRKEDRMAGLTAEVSVGDGAVMDIINPQWPSPEARVALASEPRA